MREKGKEREKESEREGGSSQRGEMMKRVRKGKAAARFLREKPFLGFVEIRR